MTVMVRMSTYLMINEGDEALDIDHACDGDNQLYVIMIEIIFMMRKAGFLMKVKCMIMKLTCLCLT